MGMQQEFMAIAPSRENYLRGIVLFGRNVASYKFALADAILRIGETGQEVVPLDDLAGPFAQALCEHLAHAPKQATSARSRFLDACRSFNAGDISSDQLQATTVSLGFNNVIDAFHVVGTGDIGMRFFVDERNQSTRGIRLTDNLLTLASTQSAPALAEIEARWRLVETAWELGIANSLIAYDETAGLLVPGLGKRRVGLASARGALNGYQKGKCFYCYRGISMTPGALDLADVDHLFPWALEVAGVSQGLNGVWNLVLACSTCNRGPRGKFALVPDARYVERLHRRNEYLISSSHPLRETLITLTGRSRFDRRSFLQDRLTEALSTGRSIWTTPSQGSTEF